MFRPILLTRCLAAGFASWLTFAPAGAHALTLGELVVHSGLGEPLRAQVPVRAGNDESIDASCVSLARSGGTAESIPYLSKASLSVENTARGQLIRIHSAQVINDPVIKILLQVTCSGQSSLSREFTLLLDPPSYAGAATSTQEEAPESKPGDSKLAPQPGHTWEIGPGDTVASIARSIYPDSPARRRQLEQAIANANPQLFQDGAEGDLPVGQALQIPQLPSTQSASGKRSRTSESTGYSRPAARKKHSQHPAPSATHETFQLKLTTGEIDLSASRNLTEEDRLKLREKQLLLEADDQVANILALKNQVKQLEARLNELNLKISSGVIAAAPPKPAEHARNEFPAVQTRSNPPAASSLRNFWIGVGILAVLLGLFFTLRRYRGHKNALEQFRLDESDALEEKESLPAAKAAIAASKPASEQGAAAEENYYDPRSIFNPPDEKITLTEVDSVVEEADLYLIYGWTQKAVDLLQGYIEKNQHEIQPWMMLLDIYRSQGKKEAFDKLAHRFKENFDDEQQWRKVQALGREFDPKNSLYAASPVETKEAGHDAAQAPENSAGDYWASAKTGYSPNFENRTKQNKPPSEEK